MCAPRGHLLTARLQAREQHAFISPAGVAALAACATQLEAAAVSQLGVRVAQHPTRLDYAARTALITKGDGSTTPSKAALREVVRPAASSARRAAATVDSTDLLRILRSAGAAPNALPTSFVVDSYGLDSSAPSIAAPSSQLLLEGIGAVQTAEPTVVAVPLKIRPESDPRILQVWLDAY